LKHSEESLDKRSGVLSIIIECWLRMVCDIRQFMRALQFP
jgi:hypothetical protein